jgi:triacylglycerol esterase/lipase EstA (alpha/beta hydrolase family)
MLSFITRASTLLRVVIVIQLIAAYFFTSALSTSWTLSALSFVAIFIALRGAIVLVQFSISWVFGSKTPPQYKLGLIPAIRMLWHELTASLTAFIWRMPFNPNLSLAQPTGNHNCNLTPVLLIHGYGCNRAMWLKFSKNLASHGHICEAINLEPVLGSIDDYPALIEQGVQALLKKTGASKIAIVAHSMGGLASRAYLKNHSPAENERIKRVVTLGTPHQGTVQASLGQGTNTQQMRIRSPWRDALATTERASDLAKFCCIFSHHDNIVAPQDKQYLPYAKKIELSAIGHVAMAYSDEVAKLVLKEL